MSKNMEYDEAFFEAVLRSHYEDPTIEVLSTIDDSAATEIGDHFMSDILQIRVNFSRSSSSGDETNSCMNETRSYILKHEPGPGSKLLPMIQREQLFTVEHRVLRDIIPRTETALGVRLGPKLVYGTDEPPRVILMEDLTSEGFCIKNNQEGLSMAHATIAIQNLARFHAGSVILSEENPEALRSFKQGILNARSHPKTFVLIVNSLNRLCEDAKGWSDEKISLAATKLKEVVPSVKDRELKISEFDAEEFCVLNHGDPRVSNILFKEDESGKPLEQVFVDYQMVCFSSPAVDLLYFLGVNPALEVRGEGEEVLLEIYLDTLTSSMKKLRCKTEPPTMRNLKEAMYRRRTHAVVSGLFFLPRYILDKDEIESMEQLLQHGTFKINPYGNPNTIRIMKRMLPIMSDRGYFDP